MKEDASDSTPWRTRFGRGYGTVVRKVREEKRIIKIELKGVDPDSWKKLCPVVTSNGQSLH